MRVSRDFIDWILPEAPNSRPAAAIFTESRAGGPDDLGQRLGQ
jgi:hypothetical protein